MSGSARTGVRLALLVGLTLLIASVAAAGVMEASATEDDDPAFVVDLEADGDATVTLVSVYDLDDEDERDAFDELRDDEATQAELADRFEERLSAVADESEAVVDREMTVSAGSTEVRTDDDRGIVAVSVEWSALAGVDDDRLTLTEPFASGFETDRPLVLVAPDDATLESATHDPDRSDDDRASWDAASDLDGFEVSYALDGDETDTDGDDGTADDTDQADDADEDSDEPAADDGLVGFGIVAGSIALAALIGIGATLRNRRLE